MVVGRVLRVDRAVLAPRRAVLAAVLGFGCASAVDDAPTPLVDHTVLITATAYDGGVVGVAAAAREGDFGELTDLYGAVVLQRAPAAATDMDEPAFVGIAPPWTWGEPDGWLELGEGMRVVGTESEVAGCLSWLGAFGDYPVYVASSADGFDEACEAMPDAVEPGERYDLEIFGGEEADDAVLVGALGIPAAPELGELSDAVLGEAFAVEWSTDEAEDDDVLQIELVDRYGNVVVVTAEDDGALTIGAEHVDRLERGPLLVVVMRERAATTTWAGANVLAVGRVERRMELELR